MGWSSVDEIHGATHLAQVDPVPWPVGHIWPWILVVLGALAIVLGAVLFTPDADTSAAAFPILAHLTTA